MREPGLGASWVREGPRQPPERQPTQRNVPRGQREPPTHGRADPMIGLLPWQGWPRQAAQTGVRPKCGVDGRRDAGWWLMVDLRQRHFFTHTLHPTSSHNKPLACSPNTLALVILLNGTAGSFASSCSPSHKSSSWIFSFMCRFLDLQAEIIISSSAIP